MPSKNNYHFRQITLHLLPGLPLTSEVSSVSSVYGCASPPAKRNSSSEVWTVAAKARPVVIEFIIDLKRS